MAKKPTITSITSGYASTNTLNDNFTALRDAFDNTLSLDGSTPNSMTSDLNLNNNDILNASRILVGGVDYIATALSYKNDAETAKTAAEAAQAAAELAYDNFDDRYLGAKSSDPTLDNDGNALIDGALYYDIANTVMKFYDTSTSTWYRTTPTTSDQANIDIVAGNTTNINTVAGISANVTTVAGISSDVTTVAADTTDIGTVATSISNVNTAATNISNINTVAGISANVTTVAGNTSNINTVAGNNSNITTVAGISSDVTTVAGQTTNLQNVTDNLTAIQNASTNATNAANSASAAAISAAEAAASADFFDDVYLGSKASDPATDNDGDALNAGDLYFNTTSNNLKVYSGSAWQDAAVDSSGFVQTTGGTMTGNLTVPNVIVSGNVDGRDVSADGAKLDGIEANADVTDTANVTAAGALMDSELTDIAAIKALNQGVATTDAPTFTNTQLDAIAATISDTAVDIFVYDTRKDSDGGAWRKRTQHTSWYNETLNTSTRGSRKEFPAVAVIVAETNQVTIYDGDDPDLPMWMVFNTSGSFWASNYMLGIGSSSFVSVEMLNGILTIANNGSIGLATVRFMLDNSDLVGANFAREYNGTIAERNSGKGSYDLADTSRYILSTFANDVAMTVLPNAPIDAATGLPVPTIAVATDTGVSVIRDDGKVVNISNTNTTYDYVHSVSFYDGGLYFPMGNGSNYLVYYYGFWTIPTADTVLTVNTKTGSGQDADAFYRWDMTNNSYTDLKYAGDYPNTYFVDGIGPNTGSTYALQLIDENKSDPEKGMVAQITSEYNTGWQVGKDIKLATLSDTDATNVTGSELITNAGPNFTNTDGWGASNGTLSVSSGDLLLTGSNTVNEHMYSTGFSLVAGQTYTLFIDSNQLFSYTRIGSTTSLATGEQLDTSTQVGLNSFTFTATTTGTFYLKLGMVTSYVTGSINSVSLRLAEEDRSVNGNGLQVFGTVTKSAVATGADLVGYSGFSTSAYLQQPYNSDLDFGTGDFCFHIWEKHTDDTQNNRWLISYDRNSTTGWVLIGLVSGLMRFEVQSSVYADFSDIPDVWTCWHFVRRNGVCSVYLNGEFKSSFDGSSANINASSRGAGLRVGKIDYTGINDFWHGSAALLRVSATAPSPEQIKKIYEDEKVLFQDGAQATLYGSSDAVTALAYDDSTELLHVGTSAGRSVFQGLKRVDNTTTAVGAAISASNGLVADE